MKASLSDEAIEDARPAADWYIGMLMSCGGTDSHLRGSGWVIVGGTE